MVKISVVYSVNKSLALYSIYSLCYLQTKSLRTSSPRKKILFWQVGTFGVFQTISDFVGWQVSILIQKYVYCSLHGMLEILFSIKILLITNEMKFTISNYLSATLTMLFHCYHVYHCWVCSFTLKMRSTVDALTPFHLISVRPGSVCSLYIV